MPYAEILFWLLVAHCVCDYPLQGDFVARAKNPWPEPHQKIPGVDPWSVMAAHCLIHAGAVAMVTGSYALGAAEFLLHAAIDLEKCDGRLGFRADQLLHAACKVLFVAYVFWVNHR